MNECVHAFATRLDIDMFSYCKSNASLLLFYLLLLLPSWLILLSSNHFLSDGIAASITISLINYVLLGFQFTVDGFFMHSFEVFLATTVVFWGSGTLGYTLLEYRLGHKKLVSRACGVGGAMSPAPFSFNFFHVPATCVRRLHLRKNGELIPILFV